MVAVALEFSLAPISLNDMQQKNSQNRNDRIQEQSGGRACALKNGERILAPTSDTVVELILSQQPTLAFSGCGVWCLTERAHHHHKKSFKVLYKPRFRLFNSPVQFATIYPNIPSFGT